MPEEVIPRKTRVGIEIISIALIVAASALGILAWRAGLLRFSKKGTEVSQRWVSPHERELASIVNATGTVKLRVGAEVRVGAQLSGIVQRLNVTVGSHVVRGQVIAEIDSRAVQARIDQARSQVNQAYVTQRKASADYARTTKLFSEGLIPKQQFDDSSAVLETAKANLTMANSSLALAGVDLTYVQIRAPINGIVASVSTQQGETVAASFTTPTFVTIIQPEALEVIAMVDEADIGNVKIGDEAQFTTETFPDREFTGRVSRIAPMATILSGVVNYEVAISIDRQLQLLRPEMTANVNITSSHHPALLVPAKDVISRDGQSIVMVRSSSGLAEKRVVVLGTRAGSDVEILRGLTATSSVLEVESGGQQR